MDSDKEREKCEDAFVAIRNNEIVKLENLLGDVRADIIDRNNKNNTLLHYAVEKGNKDIVELLLHPAWELNIHATNIVGNTPLHIAALKNDLELVKSLLGKGAESDIGNDDGKTPLDLARRPEVIGILKALDGTARSCAAIPEYDAGNVDELSEQDNTYKKRKILLDQGLGSYELQLAVLYLLHGVEGFENGTMQGFRMAVSMEAGGKVGNLIFGCRCKDLNGAEKSKITFVQAEHKENVNEVDAKQLLSVANKNADWYLKDHFWGYQTIKDEFLKGKSSDPIFGSRFEDCEFVIFTNVPFRDNFEGYEKHVSRVDVERQSIFDFDGGNHCYKLSMGGNKDDEIEDVVRSSFSSEETLPSSRNFVSRDEIDEYFGKLKLFYGQPNESELSRTRERRIQSVYRVSLNDVNQMSMDVAYRMRSWSLHGNEYLTENNNFFKYPAKVSIRFGVKNPVDLFTGRHRELGELHRSLQRSQIHSNRKVTSQMTFLTGLGGIGKTQLAREYIKKYSRLYDDNVIWMNAKSDESLRWEFRRLAQDELNIATKNDQQVEKQFSSIVAETYSFFAKRRSIFVFDNADETEDLKDFLPPRALPPNAKRPHILITSRRNEWYDGADVVKLGEFTTTEAATLVKKGLGLDEKNVANNRSIIRLVEVLQRFPLAIQQATSYITNQSRTGDVNIDEYLETYERKTRDLLDREPGTKDTAIEYEKTTYTTWKMTIEEIGKTRIGKLALKILDIIAYLASDDIRREMFMVLDCDNDLRAAVRELVNFSMIDEEEEEGQSILHVHKLVQQVTRRGQIISGTKTEIFQKTWHLLEHNLPFSDKPVEYFRKTHMLPHCKAILLHYDSMLSSQRRNSKIEDDDVVHILREVSRMLFYSGNFDRSLTINKRIIQIEEERHRSDDFSLICSLEYLGTCYIYLGHGSYAEMLFERVLKLKERKYGHNHLAIVSTLVTISDICEASMNYQEQKELIECALDIVEEQDAFNYSEISLLIYKLAFAYANLRNYQRRNELIDLALAIGEKHQHRVLSDFERSLMSPLKKQSYTARYSSIRERENGSNIHCWAENFLRVHSTKRYCKNINLQSGIIRSGLENHEIQKKLLARAVQIMENIHGTYHFGVAANLMTLGIANGFLCDSQTKFALVYDLEDGRPTYKSAFYPKFVITLLNQLIITYAKLGDRHDQEKLASTETKKHHELDDLEVGHILVGLGVPSKPLGDFVSSEIDLINYGKQWREYQTKYK